MDWAAHRGAVQFRAGTAIVPTETGWLVQLPDEEFLHVDVDAEWRPIVASVLAGRRSPAHALDAAPGAGVGDLLDALAAEGALAPAEWVPAAGRVVLVGDGPALSPAAGLLEAAGARVERSSLDELDDRRPDAVVAVSRWLPDLTWRRLDAWSAGAGVPWHRAHGEGRRWYVGPFTVPGESPGYEDLRLRRLAACEWPDDLLALWAWLDGGGAPTCAGDPGTAAVVAAALVVTDVLCHLQGQDAPGAHVQVGVDGVTGEVRRHPVLAVPRYLVTEAG